MLLDLRNQYLISQFCPVKTLILPSRSPRLPPPPACCPMISSTGFSCFWSPGIFSLSNEVAALFLQPCDLDAWLKGTVVIGHQNDITHIGSINIVTAVTDADTWTRLRFGLPDRTKKNQNWWVVKHRHQPGEIFRLQGVFVDNSKIWIWGITDKQIRDLLWSLQFLLVPVGVKTDGRIFNQCIWLNTRELRTSSYQEVHFNTHEQKQPELGLPICFLYLTSKGIKLPLMKMMMMMKAPLVTWLPPFNSLHLQQKQTSFS